MFGTDFYVDRNVPDKDLQCAFAAGFGVDPEEVAVVPETDYEAVGDRWSDLTVRILLRRSMEAGDFPLHSRFPAGQTGQAISSRS